MKKTLKDIKPGDTVIRVFAGEFPMELRVQSVTDTIIDCGWTFDRETGVEIDDDLGWGLPPKTTGSYIVVMPPSHSELMQDELEPIINQPDGEIDTSDIPEVTDWSKAVRGKFYREK